VRVLVVDDNATSRHVLAKQLGSWGCRVTTVGSAEAVMAALQEAPGNDRYRVVMIDGQLPGMPVENLARWIRQQDEVIHPVVIAMTSHTRSSDMQGMVPTLLDACLVKPMRQAQLFETIVGQLERVSGAGAKVEHEDSAKFVMEGSTPPRLGARLLVVDDNVVNQQVAVQLLKRQGFSCEIATNGVEAVERVEQHDYDLILMDCQMPVLDGYAATGEIRRRLAGRSQPVIVAMTAEAVPGDRERCLAAGMDDYLAKPISVSQLARVLRTYLRAASPTSGSRTENPKLQDPH